MLKVESNSLMNSNFMSSQNDSVYAVRRLQDSEYSANDN